MKALAPRLLSQADLFRLLGRKIAEDAMRADWIRPRVERRGERGKSLKIFAVEDARSVETRILGGEYPTK